MAYAHRRNARYERSDTGAAVMRKAFHLRSRSLKWVWMASLAVLSSSSRAQAQDQDAHCAWLNSATASGVLAGPVTLALETAPDDQTICVFTSGKTAKDYSALRIMVQPLKDVDKAVPSHESLCTSLAASLRAIGNEAIGCSADVGYSRGEQVISRVRDRLFIVTVSSTMAQDPLMTRELLREKARMIAEQVAGALF
jgi:hypothetical protein